MKKIMRGFPLVLTLILFLSLTNSPAEAGITFGAKGGFSLANIKTIPENFEGYKWENKTGLAGGVFMEIGLPGPFSIQPEVLYVQKGAKISFFEGEFSGTLKANIDYIEIPLLLKYNFISGGPLSPSVYFGPYFGFNTTAEFVISIEGQGEEREDIKDDIKNTEFGMVFGLGLTQKLGTIKLTLDARYDLGISNIIEDHVEYPSSIKTRTWLFMVGIAF
ncbi:MAG: porin family protein [Candidatus Saccharicenans sp.]|uniref:porin family protein n=1 Tax=Candidatus Saccharicenans sp. TaxID=2819258 RepID=UPI0040496BA0